MAKFKFSVENKYQKARAGSIETFHGKIKTPVFMPVGTLGSVKAIFQKDLEKLGIEKLPEAGTEMMIKAITYVKTVRESKEKDGVEQNVELQICAMGIEPFDKSKDQAKGMYETPIKQTAKATPVAKTSTYLA